MNEENNEENKISLDQELGSSGPVVPPGYVERWVVVIDSEDGVLARFNMGEGDVASFETLEEAREFVECGEHIDESAFDLHCEQRVMVDPEIRKFLELWDELTDEQQSALIRLVIAHNPVVVMQLKQASKTDMGQAIVNSPPSPPLRAVADLSQVLQMQNDARGTCDQ